MKIIIFVLVPGFIQHFLAEDALAWGPGIHTVVALSVLNDLGAILPSIARVITAFPLKYIYGSLAAYSFIGKSKTRESRHPHNWEGGFKFLAEAEDDGDAAFAYGFLSHLAADVAAHNFFVPNLIDNNPGIGTRGHIYWEARSDHLLGADYLRIAQNVMNMDHRACDEFLYLSTGRKRKGLKAMKHLYMKSVKISDFLCANRPMMFSRRMIRSEAFHEHLAFMVGLSCRMVKHFLKHPYSSPCLMYDPMGKHNLRLAKRRRLSSTWFNSSHAVRNFTVDQELLRL